jgi:hypothetical protein
MTPTALSVLRAQRWFLPPAKLTYRSLQLNGFAMDVFLNEKNYTVKQLTHFDLVLFGIRTADSDTGQVGPQTAVMLNLPLVTWAYSIEMADNDLLIERRADGFREKLALSFPAMVTVHPGSVHPEMLDFTESKLPSQHPRWNFGT